MTIIRQLAKHDHHIEQDVQPSLFILYLMLT